MLSTLPTIETKVTCPTEKVAIDNHERVIFYRLGTNHVFFDIPNRLIYFSDLHETPAFSLLETLYRNKQQAFVLELLFLDVNHCFFGGYRVKLTESLVRPLLVALSLKGTHVEKQLPKANIDNAKTPWFISKPV